MDCLFSMTNIFSLERDKDLEKLEKPFLLLGLQESVQSYTGSNVGDQVFVSSLSLLPSDVRIPFKFQRRQFPLTLSFAMTIKKSQAQSLKHVGVYLPTPVFSQGQLYDVVSRVTSREGLKILITDEDGEDTNVTSNVVYDVVFRNV
ncbi:PIF1 helicase, putative [Medicago truncatula]|uniref:PIF1 helicase, putative n=1 Tax=Medicago truncatula TaxID=3880 RepID=A0A072TZ35_MEDTR|nr:PIF1 helicase, putative [Medicago truncatula]